MVVPQEFLSGFHSLTGTTIGERRRHLHDLLNKTRTLLATSAEADVDLSSLQPRDPLEDNFRLEALMYFHKTEAVFEALKSESPILIYKALRKGSLLKRAFKDVTGEQLVTDILPRISFNAKQKLLTKLALTLEDPGRADEYFEAVRKTYGSYLAQRLISACTDCLVLKYVARNDLDITPKQLVVILRRYPEHSEAILEKLNARRSKSKVGEKYVSAFVHLANYEPEVFVKLYEKYDPQFVLGSKSTVNFVRRNSRVLIRDFHKLHKFLKVGQVCKGLDEGFEELYETYFKKSLSNLQHKYTTLIDLASHLKSKRDKVQLILATFRKFHGAQLWEYPELMTPPLIQAMPSEERGAWMEAVGSRPHFVAEEEWLSYFGTDKSIPLLKAKIALTSNRKVRMKLIRALLETHRINEDPAAFVAVCQYLLDKHRNDHITVFEEVLAFVKVHLDPAKFDADQWRLLLRIVQVFKTNCGANYHSQELEKAYIRYRLDRGLSVREELARWARESPGHYTICEQVPAYEKHCLLEFNALIGLGCLDEGDGDNRDRLHCHYLYYIVNWNRRHPRDRISPFVRPEAVATIKRELRGERYAYTSEYLAAYCIVDDYERAKQEDYPRLLFDREEAGYEKCRVVAYLLRRRPLVLRDYADKLVPLREWRARYRNYAHLDLPRLLARACRDLLDRNRRTFDEGGAASSDGAAALLSLTAAPDEFLEYAAGHVPSDSGPDRYSGEGRALHEVRAALLKSLVNVGKVSRAMECASKFCCDADLSQLARAALSGIAANATEDVLEAFVDALSAQAAPQKRLAISLAVALARTEVALGMLARLAETETDPSMVRSLSRAVLKCFCRNANDSVWAWTKERLLGLNADRAELIDLLMRCRRVPDSFRARYILFALDVLRELPETEPIREKGRVRMLQSVTPSIVSDMPDSFYREIIADRLIRIRTGSIGFRKTIGVLISRALVYNKSEGREQLTVSIVEILKDMIESGDKVCLRFVHDLVCEFCSEFLDRKCSDRSVFDGFASLLISHLTEHEMLSEFLHLKFTAIYLTGLEEGLGISGVAEKIALFCDELYMRKSWIVPVFYESFRSFLDHVFKLDFEKEDDVENRLIFVEGILNSTKTVGGLIFMLYLLPNNIDNEIFKSKYNRAIKTVGESPSPAVQVYLNHYLIKRKDWF